MNDAALVHELRIERRFVTYSVLPGSAVVVHPGQNVERGTVLAHTPRPVLLVPYAADLDLATSAATAALAVRDGDHLRRGDVLARHRAGFRVITLTAPTDGTVSVHPEAGVAMLTPVGTREIVAHAGGFVREVGPDTVSVEVTVERLDCTLASPGAAGRGIATVMRALDRTGIERLPPGTVTGTVLMPHLAEMDALRALARAGVSLVVAGTIADDLAWELLAPRGRVEISPPRTPHVVAVAGPGDTARGAAVATAVAHWHGREVWLEAIAGVVTLYTESRGAAPDADPEARAIELRDGTYWGRRAAFIAGSTHEGLTRTVVIPGEGRVSVPLANGIVPANAVSA